MKTSIEWTDESTNPIRTSIGDATGHYCEKISPGCKNCYSSDFQKRFRMPPFSEQRRSNGVTHWLDVEKLKQVLTRRKPTKWFWCSMTDMFGDWVDREMIALCFAAMAATPHHTHQVLTKRPERMHEIVKWLYADDCKELVAAGEKLAGMVQACHLNEDDWKAPLPNVWLGVSTENQEQADIRIPWLLKMPAAIRFISAEPLLGPIKLDHDYCPGCRRHGDFNHSGPCERVKLDWVIPGFESGNGAREGNIGWIISLVDQCKDAGTACFVKQLGRRPVDAVGLRIMLKSRKGSDPSEWPGKHWPQEFPRRAA